jgi:co-chaperonin GroES (HSP10)
VASGCSLALDDGEDVLLGQDQQILILELELGAGILGEEHDVANLDIELDAVAIVIAVGDGRRDEDGNRIPMDVTAGSEVLFAKYSGTEFKLEDEDLLILSEKDILAIVAD